MRKCGGGIEPSFFVRIMYRMEIEMDYKFSDRISGIAPSAIREILKATSMPDVIPLAAGNPAPDAFPVEEVTQISADIFANHPIEALQYGISEGYEPLRKEILKFLEPQGIGRDFDNILITCGAQQVMDLSSKVFTNESDTVVCEAPSFIGSLNCFRSYSLKLKGVPVMSDGMDIDALENVLKTDKRVKLIYTIPNFQNPSGVTMSLEKRKAVYALAKKYGVLILEDNPYGDLRVSGDDIPTIKSMDEDGIVIYAGSFSKILSPGIRVGYVIAPALVIAKFTVGKQANDVHTSMFSQMVVTQWLQKYNPNAHIQKIREIYRKKLNLMCDKIDECLSDYVTYNRPEGGLFVWCELTDKIDMLSFCTKAAQNKVAVVPGSAFMIDAGDKTNAIRLNFSTPTDEGIVRGIEILAETAKGML